MSDEEPVNRAIIDRASVPPMFPTHRHEPEFWEHLGGQLHPSDAWRKFWGKRSSHLLPRGGIAQTKLRQLTKLKKALTDPLVNLAEAYGKAMRDNPDTTTENVADLVEDIKGAAVIRNVLCHGSWRTPDANGASVPLFVDRKKGKFETPIDVAYLRQVQAHVADFVCSVVDTVTHMGWQFPGSAGPGKRIWTED